MTPTETLRLAGGAKDSIHTQMDYELHAANVAPEYARRLIRLREIYDAGLLLSVKEIELVELLTFDSSGETK